MLETEDLGVKSGGLPVGTKVEFPAHWPVSVVQKDGTYLRSGYVETDESQFDKTLWPKVWVNKGKPLPNSVGALGISPITGALICFVSSEYRFYRSIDGGLTWSPSIAFSQCSARSLRHGNGVWMFTTTSGSTGSGVYRSTDDGVTWQKYVGASIVNSGIEWCGGGIWITGIGNSPTEINYAYRSTDGGVTFNQMPLPVSSNYWTTALSKPSNRNIIILMSSAKTVRSTDGGASWALVSDSGGGLIATNDSGKWLKFDSASSTFMKSIDDGITWEVVVSDGNFQSGLLQFDPESNSWIGQNCSSVDDGKTWTVITGITQGGGSPSIRPFPFANLAAKGSQLVHKVHAAGGLTESVSGSFAAYVKTA